MGVLTNDRATGVFSDSRTVFVDDLGAVGDGGIDDSAAFTKALNGTYTSVKLRPGATYIVGNVKIANGVTIEGGGSRDYDAIHSYMLPRIQRKAGAAAIFDVNNQVSASYGRAFSLVGVILDGVDNTCNILSAGSVRMNMERCYVTNGLYGIGGATTGGGSAYTRVAQIIGSLFTTNTTAGVRDFIDSRFIGCEWSTNNIAIKLTPGANHNQFIGGRVEWSTSENVRLDANGGAAVDRNEFVGVQFDRGGYAGLYANNASNLQLTGCLHDRAGALDTGVLGQRSQLYFEGCTDVCISNMRATHGFNDGGGGSDTPTYVIEFNAVNTNVVINGGDFFNGSTTVPYIHYNSGRNTTQMPGHRITGVGGVEDYGPSQDISTSIAGGGSNSYAFTVTAFAVSTFSRRPFFLTVWVRDSTAGTSAMARFNGLVVRESGSATLAFSVATGEVGTAGRIGIGSGTWINIANSSVASDGSSWTMTATNAHATDSMTVEYKITSS